LLTVLFGEPPAAELVTRISDHKEQLFRQIVQGHAQPLPGVVSWLERLKDTGARQAIASSAPPANIDTLVDELGLRASFDAIVTGYDMPGKPDPAVFLKAARLINVPSERCIVVEDAVAGVEAAKRAGMKCIAVTTTNPASALREADVVVDRLDALIDDAFTHLADSAIAPR
jgi:HAD superfamily hydrolase (TIGR01509 family)